MATRKTSPPLSGWKGGKSRLAKRIIERIPQHICYVEPFAGAAWVLFLKTPSKVEVLNDLNGDIVRVYRVMKNHPEELARQFENSIISREEFERYKATPPDCLTDIQRAVRFIYLLKHSFGGNIFKGGCFGYGTDTPPRATGPSIMARIKQAFERLAAVTLENLPFENCIARYDRPHTFFYLDPPYFGCENSYGRGLFERADFERLAGQLAGLKGKFLLSLNDCPEVRSLFSGFNLEEAQTTYSCGTKPTKAAELFITNY